MLPTPYCLLASIAIPEQKPFDPCTVWPCHNSDLSEVSLRDNSAKAIARAFTPLSMSSGEAYSSGRWLQPCRQGMKSMPVGAIWAMKRESWYALLTMCLWEAPSLLAAAVAASTTYGKQSYLGIAIKVCVGHKLASISTFFASLWRIYRLLGSFTW